MRTCLAFCSLLGIALLACESGIGGGSDDDCSTVGACSRTLTAKGSVAASLADLDGGTAEACRGSACETSRLGIYNEGSADAFVRCDGPVSCRLDPSGAGLEVTFELGLSGGSPADGEPFTFRVAKKDGTKVLDATKPVTFVRGAEYCGCSDVSADVSLP